MVQIHLQEELARVQNNRASTSVAWLGVVQDILPTAVLAIMNPYAAATYQFAKGVARRYKFIA